MYREIAVLTALCILLGAGGAWLCDQPVPSAQQPDIGTRFLPPIIVVKNITADTTWEDTTLQYYVETSIWVRDDATLTIREGVDVRFGRGTGLHVDGGLVVNGTRLNPVKFSPYSANPSPMHWSGIYLENSTRQCSFNYAIIRFSEFGIAGWGTEFSVMNSVIEYAHYFGVLVAEGSSALVRGNFINFTYWVGIITDNRTDARIETNFIQTSNYGVVCYDTALVTGNDIFKCWIGILAWGDAQISSNQIRDCMDGIHSFHSSPIVEGNLIASCDGNGTRFINSNAVLRHNRFVYNNVGVDLDYESRHLLETMVNNTVNGMDIRNFYFVGNRDITLENLFIDSGRSLGFNYGSLTAQGSVTLYDCRNVTIRDSRILNSLNAVFAVNSTFKIYNSTLDNALRSQVFLAANATGSAFNRSVNPGSVMIGGENCLFQIYDDLRVRVLDHDGEPILGARVFVRESQLVLHDITTGLDGMTPVLVVKDRTISDAGVIASPLSVEVLAPGFAFDPNPLVGIYVNQTGFLTFRDLGDTVPPTILSVSVVDRERAFPVNGTITVSFSEPMNHTSAENAFFITGNVTGTFSWEEHNMTFTPDRLEYDTYYTVVISTDASDLWGNKLASPLSFSFTTTHPPGADANYVMYVAVALFAVAAVVGIIILRKLK